MTSEGILARITVGALVAAAFFGGIMFLASRPSVPDAGPHEHLGQSIKHEQVFYLPRDHDGGLPMGRYDMLTMHEVRLITDFCNALDGGC